MIIPIFKTVEAKRMKRLDREERDQDFYSYAGPSKSPSNAWDSVYWAD